MPARVPKTSMAAHHEDEGRPAALGETEQHAPESGALRGGDVLVEHAGDDQPDERAADRENGRSGGQTMRPRT